MTFTVHERFRTIQGEGRNTGRVAVFCRMAGCNLWSGREEDRATAICRFCDTEFRGGEKFASAGALAQALRDLWPDAGPRFVVFTGGEPTLQVTAGLVEACHWAGFEVAMESNGTRRGPRVDWLTVSPKAGAPLAVSRADELKLVYRQEGIDPADFDDFDAPLRYLQPMDGPDLEEHTRAAIDYCVRHPKWRLSIQTHKVLGLR
jgi:7-carboxy-7-deazaguanine synthase (Cx14CxxC type)